MPTPVELSCYERTTNDYLEAYKVFAEDPTNITKCNALVSAARKVLGLSRDTSSRTKQFEEAVKNACIQ